MRSTFALMTAAAMSGMVAAQTKYLNVGSCDMSGITDATQVGTVETSLGVLWQVKKLKNGTTWRYGKVRSQFAWRGLIASQPYTLAVHDFPIAGGTDCDGAIIEPIGTLTPNTNGDALAFNFSKFFNLYAESDVYYGSDVGRQMSLSIDGAVAHCCTFAATELSTDFSTFRSSRRLMRQIVNDIMDDAPFGRRMLVATEEEAGDEDLDDYDEDDFDWLPEMDLHSDLVLFNQ